MIINFRINCIIVTIITLLGSVDHITQYVFVKLQLSHYCYIHYHTRAEQVYNTVTTDQGTEVIIRFPTLTHKTVQHTLNRSD